MRTTETPEALLLGAEAVWRITYTPAAGFHLHGQSLTATGTLSDICDYARRTITASNYVAGARITLEHRLPAPRYLADDAARIIAETQRFRITPETFKIRTLPAEAETTRQIITDELDRLTRLHLRADIEQRERTLKAAGLYHPTTGA